MRQLVKNSNDDFRVKGYAGTNSVLLAIDLDQSRASSIPSRHGQRHRATLRRCKSSAGQITAWNRV